jgi:hypothetical protein
MGGVIGFNSESGQHGAQEAGAERGKILAVHTAKLEARVGIGVKSDERQPQYA